MPKQEAPITRLQDFLPKGTFDLVLQYLNHYKVHLTVSKGRKSILGDYHHQTTWRNHRISVNGNLNVYSFLITLLHELAHLLTFEQYGRVQSHGQEWKYAYAKLLDEFLRNKIFPPDIEKELLQSIKNPAASSCAEDNLLRVLRRYDAKGNSCLLVEELNEGDIFSTSDGRIFQKGKKMRKRFQCLEVKTGKLYLFSPIYEGHPIRTHSFPLS